MIVQDLINRQLNHRRPRQHLAGIISRLSLEEILGDVNGRLSNSTPGHKGCVNTLRFGHQENASLLLTGSDDATLKIWDVQGVGRRVDECVQSRRPLASFDTGHTSNILSTCFVRGATLLASVGMRGEVRLTMTVRNQTLSLSDHGRGAYDVQSVPQEPHLFWSAGEDGCVRQFDLRSSPRFGATDILHTFNPEKPTAFTTLSFHPLNPVYLACGTDTDPIVRIYDRRRVSSSTDSSSSPPVVLSCAEDSVVASARETKKRGRVTSVAYNRNGTELLVSYSHDYVYLFDVSGRRNAEVEEKENAEEAHVQMMPHVTKAAKAKTTFRVAEGNWSDTGPQSSMRGAGEVEDEETPGARVAHELQVMLAQAFDGGGGDEEECEGEKEEEEEEEARGATQTSVGGGAGGVKEVRRWLRPHVVYRGHRNCRTICKEANFYGMRDEYVLSGSDDGRFFVWEKNSGRVLGAKESDTRVTNCIQRRDHDLLLASTGIDHNIKLWTPTGADSNMKVHSHPGLSRRGGGGGGEKTITDEVNIIMENNERLLEQQRTESVVRLPPSLVLRFFLLSCVCCSNKPPDIILIVLLILFFIKKKRLSFGLHLSFF